MICMDEDPRVDFPGWRSWSSRESTTEFDPFLDVPKTFDLGGIYLLAHFKTTPKRDDSRTPYRHLDSDVVYIGMSSRITFRLEGGRHEKIRHKYKVLYNDKHCMCLYYSIYYSEWSTWQDWSSEMGKVKKAFLYYTERRLLWEYAKRFHSLPKLNSQ
jgi:hypothetical protein